MCEREQLDVPSPLVSVIIPAHNAAAHIGQTLESVRSQEYSHLEVLVVDDGSTDATVDIVASIAARDDRIRLLSQPNQGVAAARNRGIRESHGDFIAPLDADDLWSPKKIVRQVQALEAAGPRAALAYCWSHGIDEDGFLIYSGGRPQAEGEVFSRHLRGNFIGNGSVPLIRRQCLDVVGDYNAELRARGGEGCEDWELTLRIAERYHFCLVPEFLVAYRTVGESMSRKLDQMRRSYDLMIDDLRLRRSNLDSRDLRSSRSAFLLYLLRKQFHCGRYLGAASGLSRALMLDPRATLQDVGQVARRRLERLMWHSQGMKPVRELPFQGGNAGDSEDSQIVLSVPN